ncbi:MAG: hypothetical protein RJA81_2173 [Planctomycetota bacterium]|jgi:hypothetical protein
MSDKSGPIQIELAEEGGSVTVYHRDFPEIRTSGCSSDEAVKLLGHQLERALDSALTDWRREVISKALRETKQYSNE